MDDNVRLSAWLVFNWETRARRWLDWKEGFDKVGPDDLGPGEQLYFVSVELDPKAQFLEPVKAHETWVRDVFCKTPSFAGAYGQPGDEGYIRRFTRNLPYVMANLLTHVIPPHMYGPGRPLSTRFDPPESAYMRIEGEGIGIHLSIRVTGPDQPEDNPTPGEARRRILAGLMDADDRIVVAMARMMGGSDGSA